MARCRRRQTTKYNIGVGVANGNDGFWEYRHLRGQKPVQVTSFPDGSQGGFLV